MSRFLADSSDYRRDESMDIDFDDAVRLPGGGSTCDIYRTRWQRRDVFVKRLKEQYRATPLYLDALDKEYETGISLKHPALPEYREFHRDYIIMDYIDGSTLAEMIQRKDPWLSHEKNVQKLLRELVDVVDYLHSHNITHCDIKPDNIMITARNHNLVLIDLDKCYTDALNDTSGDPSKYGVAATRIGNASIDFQGIALIAKALKEDIPGFKFSRYKGFVAACRDKDVNTDDLLTVLDYQPSTRRTRLAIIIAGVAILCIIGGIVLYIATRADKDNNSEGKVSNMETTVNPGDSVTAASNTAGNYPAGDYAVRQGGSGNIVQDNQRVVEQEDLHTDAQGKARILDGRIKPMYDELQVSLNRLLQLKSDSSLTADELLKAIREHGNREDECAEEMYAIAVETFPGISDREYWRILSYSKVYTGYKRKAEPALREIGQEIERRRDKGE